MSGLIVIFAAGYSSYAGALFGGATTALSAVFPPAAEVARGVFLYGTAFALVGALSAAGVQLLCERFGMHNGRELLEQPTVWLVTAAFSALAFCGSGAAVYYGAQLAYKLFRAAVKQALVN